MKNLMLVFLCTALLCSEAIAKESQQPQQVVSTMSAEYARIVEKLLFYKKDRFAVFYGGPIRHNSGRIRWVMYASFEDESYQTRSCYEIAFVHCDMSDAQGADILFIEASDINIKFKNTLSRDYEVFSFLCRGEYSSKKYIVVRNADVAVPFYPNIYIASLHGAPEAGDKNTITRFLHKHFKTKKTFSNYYATTYKEEVDFRTDQEISYKPILLHIDLQGTQQSFYLVKKIVPNDPWKLYYLIFSQKAYLHLSTQERLSIAAAPLLRIDSGCISGQIYDDNTCDCLDQLHGGLREIAQHPVENSMIVHIPAHDGRGFGSAPKAETEIYKHGGRGRVHAPTSLDTMAAAEALYGPERVDIRTFEGAARLVKALGISRLSILTDNIAKVKALQNHGISIVRIPTNTHKTTCEEHLASKRKHKEYYYND